MLDKRENVQKFLASWLRGGPLAGAVGLAVDCLWEASAPLSPLVGSAEIEAGFLVPLRRALTGLHRRDEIFIGAMNRRHERGFWCAAVTHYVGNFTAPLWGIAPSHHVAFLRAGEFYRVQDGRIVQARIILDLPDLMRQAGRLPFPFSYGLETLFPGPATHDGVCPQAGDGEGSLDIVEAMLGDLHRFDPQTLGSAGQTGKDGYWADDMLWYGPAGIGSNFRWDGFVKDHRAPFLRAFPDRKGGNHYCRIGDGSYAAVSGWPSMTMTFQGDYLGVKADGRPLTLRVMDFYRCQDGKIAENWVFLDYVDLFAQMGVDLLSEES
ncbi:nuclear transport factor 2 family protein [Paracoccus spongiarum]|uniref:Ester cyclase n=1 Tax=Paracoccus spongiarum TaxID=3064387 RepID=A0ABT9JGH1_9RHOB|nr:ester cyclase [Paracoccus sp. 2205BS29-5]MDP5308908.1 ester cyclase [Paracoccus sp. 2205BS29-5]